METATSSSETAVAAATTATVASSPSSKTSTLQKHQHLRKQQFHYGLVFVSDGKCRPQPARLKVCPEYLVLQKEEFIFPEDDDGIDNKLRTVKLKRQPDGSLGFSIKGGTDHNLPVLVSKVCRNEDDDHLYIGDAIVKVNRVPLANVTHDEAINVLRNAGVSVTLTVKHYRSAAPFLLRNLRQFIAEQDQNGGTATSPLDGNRNSTCNNTTAPTTPSTTTSSLACSRKSSEAGNAARKSPVPIMDSPCSVASDVSGTWNGGIHRVRRKWVDVLEVPLMMAYITRYIFGTDKIRPNSFEVRGMNGSNTGVIHSPDIAVLSHWIKLISDFITALTSLKGAQFNRQFSPIEQISYMNWVSEGVLNTNQPWQNWKPKFFSLRGADVCIFEKPPLELSDWSAISPSVTSTSKPRRNSATPDPEAASDQQQQQEQSYKVYEAMFRVIKESEYVDERQHCFLIQTAGQESRYFSMETRADLLKLESAWHRAVCSTISQIGSKTFHVVYKHVPAAFTIDWTDGFLLKPFASPNYHFIYAFSQLKSSSDDGNAKLTLLFQDMPGSQELIEQELICPKLQNLLFFMHAFLTAKVASLDPTFLSRGRIA